LRGCEQENCDFGQKTESLNTLQARLYYHEQKSEDIESVSKYSDIPEQRVIKGREKRK
jgi:hypothetical protein